MKTYTTCKMSAATLDRDELQMPGLRHLSVDASEFELFIADLLKVSPTDRNGNVRSFGTFSSDNEPGVMWMVWIRSYNDERVNVCSDYPCYQVSMNNDLGDGCSTVILVVPDDFPNVYPKPGITIYDSSGQSCSADSIMPSMRYNHYINVSRWIPDSTFDISILQT
jgi:hypothetical protein